MQKKALVLAIGAALMVSSAYAQKKAEPDSVVELYGKIYPELVFPDSKGATAAGAGTTCTICEPGAGSNAVVSRTEMESSNSRLGVRGHEKLGPHLKAIFQLEALFQVDGASNAFATRDSFVGLAGGWGTVKLGRMDTPFKDYGDDVSFLGVSSGNFTSTSSIYRHIGFGGQNNAARFHERRVNAVQYESPDFGPAEFKVQYSNNENKTATRNPEVWSFGGQLEFGNFAILLGHEIHEDLFGGSRNARSSQSNFADQAVRSTDKATAIAFKWKVGKHEFGIDANEKKYEERGTNVTGRFRSYKNNAYMFVWDARWSPKWRTAFHYVKATSGKCSLVNATCNTNGLDGTQISAGVAYHFTRRTFLFLMGSWVKNGHSATYNNGAQDLNPGEDLQQIAFGIHTSF